MTDAATYAIRPPRPSEHAFVLANFVNGWVKNQIANMRADSKRWSAIPIIFRSVDMEALCSYYHGLMSGYLAHGRCMVAADESDVILLGFIVAGLPNSLYWIYVKPGFSGFGIDTDLLAACHLDPSSPVLIPHRNSGIVRLLRTAGFRDL